MTKPYQLSILYFMYCVLIQPQSSFNLYNFYLKILVPECFKVRILLKVIRVTHNSALEVTLLFSDVYTCFIDHKKTFNRVNHNILMEALHQTNFDNTEDLRIISQM